jgi:hypothetical protein
VVGCFNVSAAGGSSGAIKEVVERFPVPMTAKMPDYERPKIVAAYNGQVRANAAAAEKAAAEKAEAERKAKREAELKAKLAAQYGSVATSQQSGAKSLFKTPTPAPNPLSRDTISLKEDHASAKFLVRTPTPPPRPQYPPYGAAYSWSAVIVSMTVNQNLIMPITVRNLSSQTWPAGGAFRLSYHWYRGGAELIHDGARTLLPAAVAPGASVTLAAKLNAPPSAGVSACRWDMVQEATGFQQATTTWFSEKGVAMSAPQTVTVVP